MESLIKYEFFETVISNHNDVAYLTMGDNTPLKGIYAEYRGNIIGWVIYKRREKKPAQYELISIYVRPSNRNCGIGTKLIELIFKNVSETCTFVVKARIFCNRPNIADFLSKNGFSISVHDCIGYMISKESWDQGQLPFDVNEKNFKSELIVVDTQNLSSADIHYIISNEKYLPHYLQYNQRVNGRSIRLLFKNTDNEIVGWCIGSYSTDYILDLKCTYILNKYRGMAYVFYFWRAMQEYTASNNLIVKYIVFHFDNNNIRLKNFYNRIFSKFNPIIFDSLTFIKNVIPILQTT